MVRRPARASKRAFTFHQTAGRLKGMRQPAPRGKIRRGREGGDCRRSSRTLTVLPIRPFFRDAGVPTRVWAEEQVRSAAAFLPFTL